jgi:DNA-binding transcriptional LysR family regulator
VRPAGKVNNVLVVELELKHLRHLAALASAGSLNRAAARLQLPQPALSRELQRIEKLLGGVLFERDHRGVRPTAFGRQILDHATTILRSCDEIGPELDRRRTRPANSLRVGWSTSTLSGELLRVLESLRGDDDVELRLADSTGQVLDWLADGRLDLALLSEQGEVPTPANTERVALVDDPLLVMLPAWHHLAEKSAVGVEELKDERWILTCGRDSCVDFLCELCRPFGFAPQITHRAAVSKPRADVVCYLGGVTVVQSLRPEAHGVVHRPLRNLPMTTKHFLLLRRDSTIFSQRKLLSRLMIDAYWDRVHRQADSGSLLRHAG